MRRYTLLLLVMVCWLLPAAVAHAAFPGQNGMLAVAPLHRTGLILTSANGAHKRRICGSTAVCGHPQRPMFSPDGRSLVFAGPKMRLIGTDGTCENCHLGLGAVPSFRENGTAISFISPAPFRAGAPVSLTPRGVLKQDAIDGLFEKAPQIQVKDPTDAVWSGSGRLAVVSHGHVLAGPPSRLHPIGPGADPSWAPTGTRLAVAREGWVTLVSVPGSRARRLVRGTAPAFSPDGRWIAYFNTQHQLHIIRASGGRPREVGDVRGRAVDWQPLPARPTVCVASPGSKVLARSDQAIVTEDSRSNMAAETGAAVVSGCLFSDGREYVLRHAKEDDYGSGIDFPVTGLGGFYAGLVTDSFDAHYGGGTEELSVFDLRTGKPSGFGGEQTCSPNAGPEGDFCPGVIDQVAIGTGGVSAVYLGGAASLPVAQHVVCSPDPSTSLCVTSDDYGEISASTSPSTGPWNVTAGVRPDNGFMGGGSCPSASLCVLATDSTISTSTSPSVGPWTTITFPGNLTFESVACPSTALCVATTATGQVAVSTDPTGGLAAWSLQDIDAENGLYGLSCPSTTECVGTDSAHNALTTTDPTGGPSAWAIQSVAGSVGGLGDISCPTTSFCAATATGGIATTNDPIGNAWTISPGSPTNSGGLTCPTASLCVYFSQYDIGASNDPAAGPWNSFSTKNTDFEAGTISCTGPTLCIAAGGNGTALVSTDPSGSADAWAPVQSDPVNCTIAGLEPQGPCVTEQIISSDRSGIHTLAQHNEYTPQTGQQLTGFSIDGDTLQWLDQGNPMTSQLTP